MVRVDSDRIDLLFTIGENGVFYDLFQVYSADTDKLDPVKSFAESTDRKKLIFGKTLFENLGSPQNGYKIQMAYAGFLIE